MCGWVGVWGGVSGVIASEHRRPSRADAGVRAGVAQGCTQAILHADNAPGGSCGPPVGGIGAPIAAASAQYIYAPEQGLQAGGAGRGRTEPSQEVSSTGRSMGGRPAAPASPARSSPSVRRQPPIGNSRPARPPPAPPPPSACARQGDQALDPGPRLQRPQGRVECDKKLLGGCRTWAHSAAAAASAFSSAAARRRRHRPRTRPTSSAVHAAAAAAPWSTARRAMPRAVSCTAVRSKPCRPPARTYRHDVLYHAGGKGTVSRGALEALQATGAGGQREEFRWA